MAVAFGERKDVSEEVAVSPERGVSGTATVEDIPAGKVLSLRTVLASPLAEIVISPSDVDAADTVASSEVVAAVTSVDCISPSSCFGTVTVLTWPDGDGDGATLSVVLLTGPRVLSKVWNVLTIVSGVATTVSIGCSSSWHIFPITDAKA